MIIPESVVEAVAEAIGSEIFRQEPDEEDRMWARAIIAAAVPHIRAAERARIAELIEPARLELLAAWLDVHDKDKGASNEVQRDLRLWAAILRGGEPGPDSVTEVLLDATKHLGLVSR